MRLARLFENLGEADMTDSLSFLTTIAWMAIIMPPIGLAACGFGWLFWRAGGFREGTKNTAFHYGLLFIFAVLVAGPLIVVGI